MISKKLKLYEVKAKSIRFTKNLMSSHLGCVPNPSNLMPNVKNTRRINNMKKQRKSYSAKKPPVPLKNHSELEDWVQHRVIPDLQPIVKKIDELICNNVSGLQYAIKWGKVYYGLPEHGWIIEMAAYDVSVNIVFLAGKELDPPPPLGDDKRARYIKLKTLEEVNQPKIQKWIQQASHTAGWK